MKNEKTIKSEKHHWWPQTISKYWVNSRGFINRLDVEGENVEVKPKSLAVIKNAHIFKLSDNPEARTAFDQNFEHFFDIADSNSNKIVKILSEIWSEHFKSEGYQSKRYNFCSSENHSLIIEIIVSLAVRSPMYRDRIISTVESIRGGIQAFEKDRLISLNMRDALGNVTKYINNGASIYLLLSKEKEFIFGDGFYHDIPSVTIPGMLPTIACPLTPHICVILDAKEKKSNDFLVSISLSEEEVLLCNNTIQIYSKNEIFFRNDKPVLSLHFTDNQRKEYLPYDNPLLRMIENIKK